MYTIYHPHISQNIPENLPHTMLLTGSNSWNRPRNPSWETHKQIYNKDVVGGYRPDGYQHGQMLNLILSAKKKKMKLKAQKQLYKLNTHKHNIYLYTHIHLYIHIPILDRCTYILVNVRKVHWKHIYKYNKGYAYQGIQHYGLVKI